MTREIRTTIPPVCLTIAGLDPSGGAGVLADIKTFSAFGCFGTAAISSVTFQNTTGVFGAVHQTAASVRKQAEPVFDDFEVTALKTGMLPTTEIIETVAEMISERRLKNVVVDPVVRSTSGFDLIDDEALRSLIEALFPLSNLITPNIPEAERIARMTIKSVDDICEAAEIMRKLGAKNVLIKGGHFPLGTGLAEETRISRDHLFIDGIVETVESEYIETTSTHGTGCVLAAAVAANLARGRTLNEAVRLAKEFVTNAIRTSPGLGHGNSPINI